MNISTKPIYVSNEEAATMILVESAMNPDYTVKQLRERVLYVIRLKLRVHGFDGLTQWYNEARGYTFLHQARLETCYKVATKLIKWDAIGSIDRILKPNSLNEVHATI